MQTKLESFRELQSKVTAEIGEFIQSLAKPAGHGVDHEAKFERLNDQVKSFAEYNTNSVTADINANLINAQLYFARGVYEATLGKTEDAENCFIVMYELANLGRFSAKLENWLTSVEAKIPESFQQLRPILERANEVSSSFDQESLADILTKDTSGEEWKRAGFEPLIGVIEDVSMRESEAQLPVFVDTDALDKRVDIYVRAIAINADKGIVEEIFEGINGTLKQAGSSGGSERYVSTLFFISAKLSVAQALLNPADSELRLINMKQADEVASLAGKLDDLAQWKQTIATNYPQFRAYL